ncbi:hypothetical protein C8J55DRAFT_493289 [Lentinula edodes]|uniref:Uncharacterized protein n=1 Tax=Lentinula lateritia TaxID=40482 RepID=A0A9W8ZT55_9AGAR|nr:hypothetical protein C8J55DRAFT_493289 [Lentinula edodes]
MTEASPDFHGQEHTSVNLPTTVKTVPVNDVLLTLSATQYTQAQGHTGSASGSSEFPKGDPEREAMVTARQSVSCEMGPVAGHVKGSCRKEVSSPSVAKRSNRSLSTYAGREVEGQSFESITRVINPQSAESAVVPAIEDDVGVMSCSCSRALSLFRVPDWKLVDEREVPVCGCRESSNEISRGIWRPDCRQRLPERPTSQHNLKAEINAKRP